MLRRTVKARLTPIISDKPALNRRLALYLLERDRISSKIVDAFMNRDTAAAWSGTLQHVQTTLDIRPNALTSRPWPLGRRNRVIHRHPIYSMDTMGKRYSFDTIDIPPVAS